MSRVSNWQGTAEMIRRVDTAKGRQQAGLFSIEGIRLVERALRAGAPVEALLMSESFSAAADPRTMQLRQDIYEAGIPTVIAPDALLNDLTGGRNLGAILGLVRLAQPSTLAQLMAQNSPGRSLFLAGVDIIDPGNAGALVRTAHAAGATAFLAAGSTDPFHPRATRISRGSIFRMPVIHFSSAESLLSALHALGIRSIATAAAGGVSLPDFAPSPEPAAVLMGNEGEGLPEAVQRAVDTIVTIPMPDGVDSFAVNAAAAIVLYEIQRSGWQPGHQQTGDAVE